MTVSKVSYLASILGTKKLYVPQGAAMDTYQPNYSTLTPNLLSWLPQSLVSTAWTHHHEPIRTEQPRHYCWMRFALYTHGRHTFILKGGTAMDTQSRSKHLSIWAASHPWYLRAFVPYLIQSTFDGENFMY